MENQQEDRIIGTIGSSKPISVDVTVNDGRGATVRDTESDILPPDTIRIIGPPHLFKAVGIFHRVNSLRDALATIHPCDKCGADSLQECHAACKAGFTDKEVKAVLKWEELRRQLREDTPF